MYLILILFKYFSSNLLLFHLYNIFTVYFPSSSSLLKSLFSIISNFSYLLTSALKFLSNFTTTLLVFSKFFSLSYILFSAVNFFYHTKYFVHFHTFLLFDIFCIFYSFTPSTSISFTSSIFCLSTYSLYLTTWLMFTTRWIIIEVGSCNLTMLVNTTSLIIYRLIYQSTNFFASLSLNTKSFMLSIILSLFFHFLASFILLSACYFIFSCTFSNTTLAFSYIFFLLFANFITFSTFPSLLIFASTFNSIIIYHKQKHLSYWMYLIVYCKFCHC